MKYQDFLKAKQSHVKPVGFDVDARDINSGCSIGRRKSSSGRLVADAPRCSRTKVPFDLGSTKRLGRR